MEQPRENSLRDNPHFEVKGMFGGRIICLCKSSGELASLNPHSMSEILKLAKMDWWIARGWRVAKSRGAVSPDWKQATQDLTRIAESIGELDRATYDELIRQRARKRFAKMRAHYEAMEKTVS